MSTITLRIVEKGGKGSGHHGHSGRRGKVGGSVPDANIPIVDSYEDLKNAHENPKYWILPDGRLLDNVLKDGGPTEDHSISMKLVMHEDWYKNGMEKYIKEMTDEAEQLGMSSLAESIKRQIEKSVVDVAVHSGAIRVGQYYDKLYVHTGTKDKSTLKKLQRLIDDGKLEFKVGGTIIWDTSGLSGTPYTYEEFMTASGVIDGVLKEHKTKIALKGGPGSGHYGHSGRPGKVGGSIPGKGFDGTAEETFGTRPAIETFADTDARVANIMSYVKDKLNKFKFNSLHGVVHTYEVNKIAASPEKIAEVQRVLEDSISKCRVCIRVRSDILLNILEDGEIYNQFETQHSGGALDNDWRARAENTYFGIDGDDRDPAHHPIYGYLADTLGGSKANTNHYGDLIIELNEDVADRTTVTGFDSLNQEGYGMPASPMREPSWKSFYDAEREEPNVDAPTKAHRGEYIEAQIHGGIDIYDIKKIWFPVKKYKEDIYTNAVLRGYEPLIDEINNNFPMISTEIVMWEHENELNKILLRD